MLRINSDVHRLMQKPNKLKFSQVAREREKRKERNLLEEGKMGRYDKNPQYIHCW